MRLPIDSRVHREIVEPVARAVECQDAAELAGVLMRLHAGGCFRPELFAPANPARYMRRLIHRDARGAFIIVAMTWGPGQRAMLHDHEGLWGAEIVAYGNMYETAYTISERSREGRYRFARGEQRVNVPGTVGKIVPPLEYHDFGNASDAYAHTVHVYAGDLLAPQLFSEAEDGWWDARRVEVRYDA